jgi:hypothetical protein
MKRYTLSIILLISLSLSISADAAPPPFGIKDIISPGEKAVLLRGNILTYARIEGKGEVFAGGAGVSFPGRAGRMYDYPSGYSVAAVEKAFFKGDAAMGEIIFNRLIDFPALRGMQYYSLSEGKAIPLILDSRVSGNSSIKQEIGGKSAVSYFTIKDNRLGTIPFSSKVWSGNAALSSISVCSGTVSRFGMKVFEPGDYRAYKFLVYDKTAGGWFYCSVQLMRVRSEIMKSLDLLKPENICNRLRGETVHILRLLGIDRRGDLAAFR